VFLSQLTLGTVKDYQIGNFLSSQKLLRLDVKKFICENYSEFSRGYFWNSIYMNKKNKKEGSIEIISHIGIGNSLKKFYESIKCDNHIKNFS